MSHETDKDLRQKKAQPGVELDDDEQTPAPADSGQPASRPLPPASTTIRSKSAPRYQTARRPGQPRAKKSYGVELAMAMVLGALVLGIVIILIATSATSEPATNRNRSSDLPTSMLQGQLTPRNAATANAVISQVAGQDLSTAVPVAPTPTGGPLNSRTDSQGLSWPLAGGNPNRTRYSPSQLTFPLKKNWDREVGGEIASSPAIANGRAFFGSSNGSFYAVDLTTGEIKWKRNAGPVISSPAVAGNTVFFGTTSGIIYALDTVTGQDRWPPFPTIEQVISSPVVVDGVVYIGSNLGVFWAIDANTGKKRWSAQIGNANGAGINTSPAVANGLVYFGANNGYFYAMEAAQSNPDKPAPARWIAQSEDGKGLLSSPAVADGLVYFATEGGKLYAYGATDGQKKWAADLGGPSRSSPAVADGVVYIGASSKKVFAFDAKTGARKWEFATGDAIYSSPTLAGDTLLIGSNDTYLYALDRATGAEKWKFATDDVIGSAPAVADGKVYLTSFDGRIYAFGN